MAIEANFSAEKEKKKLQSIVRGIPPKQKKLVEGLIADASFMAEQLEVLRAYITEHGWSEEYKNGENQFGKKTSVEAQMYVQVQKSYAATIRQLRDCLPDGKTEEVSKAGEALAAFIAKGKPKD